MVGLLHGRVLNERILKMQTFVDKDGSSWSIDLSIGIMEEIKGKLDIDLLDPINENDSLVMNLAPISSKNIMLFVNMLFLLCEDQCKERDVSDVQFGKLLNMLSLQGSYDAFFKEWEDFFLSLGRKEIAEAMKKMQEVTAEVTMELTEKIRNLSQKDLQEVTES